eukprot:12408173-Karenia_brevis.AAC.1
MRIQAYLQHRLSPGAIWNSGPPLARLAAGRYDEFLQRFDTMVGDPWWATTINSAPPASRPFLHLVAKSLISYNATAFHRRVVRALQQYPYKLFVMLLTPKSVACNLRQSVAVDILATPIDGLEISTKKIRLLFTPELEQCKHHGTLAYP